MLTESRSKHGDEKCRNVWKIFKKNREKNKNKNSLKREKERKRGGRKRREGHAPPSPIDILFGPRFGCQVIREKTHLTQHPGRLCRKKASRKSACKAETVQSQNRKEEGGGPYSQKKFLALSFPPARAVVRGPWVSIALEALPRAFSVFPTYK